MTHANSLTPPLDSESGLDAEKIGVLIASVAKIADMHRDLGDRRTEILTLLIEFTGASAGLWAWGFSEKIATDLGNVSPSVVPIAAIDVGFTPIEKAGITKMGLDPSMDKEFRLPMLAQLQERQQCTSLRTDLYNDQDWKNTTMYANHVDAGFDEWIHCVRYRGSETWASIHLARRIGSPPFLPADRQWVDLAMGSVPWLAATLDNSLPAESGVELTSRQRVVLLLQLDGLSRKQIASRLNITLDTVGDHLKKIYEHFDISSTGELAALFLRNR